MLEWKTVVITIVLCACASYVGSYPNGAPQGTCNDMVPRHGDIVPQEDQSPFTVLPSMLKGSSGDKLKLMLGSQDNVSFAGFMLQARSPVLPGEPIGTFTNLPDMAKALTCGSGIKNTATHKDRTPKKSLEFEWEAPSDYEGPVVFNATFVKNGAVFWVGVESDNVQIVKRSVNDPDRPPIGISTTKSPIRVTTIPNYTLEPEVRAKQRSDPMYDGCGSVKTCFGFPSGCVSSQDCNILSVVFVKGDTYMFQLSGKATDKGPIKYVALGLSENEKMQEDSVMECAVDDDNNVDVYMSWNQPTYGNIRLNNLKDKVKLINSSYTDGNIACTFTRDPITTVQDKIFDLTKDEYYLLIASGTSLKENSVGYHAESKAASSSAIRLSETAELGAASNLLYRLHGAFMIAAWIGCASTGILLARYFKQTWVGSQLCGKDQWFQWHRIFMICTWTLTVAGFVIIFVQIQDWYSETSNPHAIIGCVTTGLAFIQPFMAALRPTPDSPKRPIFNWSHWFVGNCAHILAIVTIFFSVKLTKAELPEWMDWVLVSFVAFHVLMHLIYSISGCISDRQWEKRVNDFPMQDMSSSRSVLHAMDRKRDSPHSCLRKFLLAIYLVVILALTVFLIVIVVMAPIEEHWAFKKVKNLIFSQN